jgi:hypothetical protein
MAASTLCAGKTAAHHDSLDPWFPFRYHLHGSTPTGGGGAAAKKAHVLINYNLTHVNDQYQLPTSNTCSPRHFKRLSIQERNVRPRLLIVPGTGEEAKRHYLPFPIPGPNRARFFF